MEVLIGTLSELGLQCGVVPLNPITTFNLKDSE